MKKRIIAIATVMMLAVVPAMSQVFMTDEELNGNRSNRDADEIGVMVPMENSEMDQYKFTPVGEGLLVLAGLAGAYLIGKRKKED